MFNRRFQRLMLLVILNQSGSFAQDVRAIARVDSNNILIGDWVRLQIEVQHPTNFAVERPFLTDSLQGLEVLSREAPLIRETNQSVLETSTFTLTAFDSGTFIIPPFEVYYSVAGDTAKHVATTSPIPIFVHGLAIDTTKEIKDVNPPLNVPISFAEVLPYLIGVLVVGGIIFLIYYIRRKRKRGESLLPEVPPRPAHEVAREALRALESERLWQRGKVKEYQSELTDIIRTYIEKRFVVMAMELTTDETLESDQIVVLRSNVYGKLQDILVRADLVKFAKFQPTPEDHEKSLALALDFVEETWRQEVRSMKQEVSEEVSA